MDRPKQDMLLGIVFFVGLGLLLWATVSLTGFSLSPPTEMRILFARADGLRAGDPVFVLGHRLGQVKSLAYRAGAAVGEQIGVEVVLDAPLALAAGYQITIEDSSLLGGKQIEIEPGSGEPVATAEVPLSGQVRSNAIDALGDLLGDPKVKDDIRGFVAGLREAVDRVNSNETSIGKLFTESNLYDELLATVESARRSVEELEKAEGALGRVIYDKELGDTVVQLADKAENVVDKVDRGEGLLGQIVNDSELTRDANELVGHAADLMRDLREGKGALGKFLSDPETEAEVKRITSGLADAADKLNDPEAGLLGELFGGKELREDAKSLVADLSAVADEVRNGNGLLNRLVYDDEMGEQLNRILNQVSRAIEDAREAAPIGTFFQVFSAAF